MRRCYTFASYRGRCHRAVGGCWGKGRVDKGFLEGMVPAEGGQGRGREYVPGGGISLEVVEMASDDLLDVDADGMVGEDKGNPIAVAGGKRRVEGGSSGN
eukprot:g17092.t1